VKFVTLEAYIEAGGTVRHDLFTEDSDILTDEALLNDLVEKKFTGIAAELTGKGWNFAVRLGSPGFENHHDLHALDWRKWLTSEEAEIINGYGSNYGTRKGIENAAVQRMIADDEARAKSGVVMNISYEGALICDYGVVHPDDVLKEDAVADGESPKASALEKATEAPTRLPKAQLEGLSETLTVALSRTLATAPNLALAITCAALSCWTNDAIQLRTRPWDGIAIQHDHGTTFAKALAIAQGRTTDDNMNVLAALVATLVDVRDSNFAYRDRGNRDALIAALCSPRLETELHEVFDAQVHFSRAPASECVLAANEIGCTPAIKGLKKVAMVQVMAAEAQKAGWLPPELRTVNYTGPKAADGAQDAARKERS
jgi:hypothetical protein